MQAVKYIEYDSSFSEEEKKQSKVLKIACNLNDAACKLKLKDYKQAEKLCTKVGFLYARVTIICIGCSLPWSIGLTAFDCLGTWMSRC